MKDIFSLNDSQIATVRNDKLGFIFQSYNLINRTTVLKNVEFPGIIGGMSDADRRRRALKLLDFLGIKNKANFLNDINNNYSYYTKQANDFCQ